jgi:hypothetical protein
MLKQCPNCAEWHGVIELYEPYTERYAAKLWCYTCGWKANEWPSRAANAQKKGLPPLGKMLELLEKLKGEQR